MKVGVSLLNLILILLSVICELPVEAYGFGIYRNWKSIAASRFGNQNTPLHSTSKDYISPTREWMDRPGPWDEDDLHTLLEANQAWSKRLKEEQPDFFDDCAKGHAPKILWIGCSDARVPANEVIGQAPGNVFVHRNVANMVVNTDFNCMSVIQYAVDVLKVKHIIVCGHYDCGGVKAALEAVDHKPPLENWLRNIRDTVRLHKDELNTIQDMTKRQRRLVELNVQEQCLNIYKTASVQRRRIETYGEIGQPGSKITFAEPRIHAFVYEPKGGLVEKLPVDFRQHITELRGVYDLYQVQKQESRDAATATATTTSATTTTPDASPVAAAVAMVEAEEGEEEQQAAEPVAPATTEATKEEPNNIATASASASSSSSSSDPVAATTPKTTTTTKQKPQGKKSRRTNNKNSKKQTEMKAQPETSTQVSQPADTTSSSSSSSSVGSLDTDADTDADADAVSMKQNTRSFYF